jgi:O-antigen/teichoic acid export membrane protein
VDTTLVILFGIWIAATFLLTLPNSFLLGLLRYKAYAFFVVLSSFIRFLIPAGLVLAGYGLTGTFTGLILSVIIAFLISLLLLKRNVGNLRNNTANISSDLSDVFKFVMPVVMVNLAMILLNNVDLVLVKKYFDAESAGYYAGVVTLGKIFLFGAGTVAVVMFPRISSLKASGGKILSNFSLYLFLQLTVVVLGIFAYTMFPKILTLLFFGSKFLASVTYLPLFSVFVGLYVTINFLVMFLLAIDKSKVYVFLLPGVVAQYLLINFYHDSLFQIIKINISVSALLVGAIALYLFRLFRKDFRSTS